MSDRELLELAAKAAGIEVRWREDDIYRGSFERRVTPEPEAPMSKWLYWRPLTDDGDALRLAAAVDVFGSRDDLLKFYSWMEDALVVIDDHAAAFRRAITCYAAEIGKQNPS